MKTQISFSKLIMVLILTVISMGAMAQSTVDPDHACLNTTENYYVVSTSGSTYNWVLSGGGTIASGQGSAAITINWTAAGSYTLTVTETITATGCIGAPVVLNITVDPLPVITLTGASPVCVSTSGEIYTTEAGMTGYVWVVSAGGTVTAGGTATDNTVTVTWTTAGAQSVSVNYLNANGCTAAAPTVRAVTVNPLPVTSPIWHN
jgi:hypothetical protein